MDQFGSGLGRFYKSVLVALNYASVFLIFLMAIWVFCDVVGRYVLNHPIPGTTELVKCYIVAIVFLGVAYTLNQKRHIRTTILLDRLSPVPRVWCDIFCSLIGALIFSGLCYFSFKEAWAAWLVREFDGVQLKVPVYPARFTIVLGSGLFVIQEVIDIFTQVAKLKPNRGGTAR
ncbi:MAG: TRAP transporter small permease [Deltaproteobacteria bacterium]|nr:TRAP transporter small permease [Deltaproteobacteria bacterium]